MASSQRNSRKTPLSMLLQDWKDADYSNIPLEAVRLLLNADPGATLMRDDYSRRPVDCLLQPNPRGGPAVPTQILETVLSYVPDVSLRDVWNSPTNWTLRMQAISYFQQINDDEEKMLHKQHLDCCPPLLRNVLLHCRHQLGAHHFLESIHEFRRSICHFDHKGRQV